jgi:hypothetical protein
MRYDLSPVLIAPSSILGILCFFIVIVIVGLIILEVMPMKKININTITTIGLGIITNLLTDCIKWLVPALG